jgi:integrase
VWEFRYYETDEQGGRTRRAITVGPVDRYPTESAARKAAGVQAILLRINAGQPAADGSVDFAAVIARYEQEEMPERYSTRAGYRSYIDNYIRRRWSSTPLNGIKAMAVEDWLRNLELAPKTKSHIRSLMHTIFDCAARWELTEKNPIKLVRVRGSTKRLQTPRVLTPEQFQLLLATVREPYRLMVLLAGCLGLRVSEIVALKWPDFDFVRYSLLVQRSIVHGRVGDVKTEYSRDIVPLDPALAEILINYKKSSFATPEEWLFANPVTGRPYHQEEIQKRHIAKAGRTLGFGDNIGWHTFRHSYRSWLDDTGAPLTVQKELMRHASVQTTMNVYGKAMAESKRRAHSEVVDRILGGSEVVQNAAPRA